MSIDRPRFPDIPDNQDRIIENPSQELLHHAVATFPLEPEIGEINLVAIGTRDENKYLEICKMNRIAPHTKLELEYNAHGYYNAKQVDMETTNARDLVMAMKAQKQRTTMLLFGAQSSDIKVDTMGKGLAEFNLSIRPTLHDIGYQIHKAILAVATYETRDDGLSMGGTNISTGVELSSNSIRLQFGICTEEQRQKLIDWFDKVKQEHLQNQTL